MSSGTWKGVDKPGGANFHVPQSYRHLPDCPACKFGTIIKQEENWKCIDCKRVFTALEIRELKP